MNGKGVLTPFVGACADYREEDGLLVPFQVEASWVINGSPLPYARFFVERLEFDRPEPF